MKTISILNNKGGVGKTTTAISLAVALSTMGNKILLIDLDGQANMTNSLGITDVEKSLYDNLKGDEHRHIYNVCDNVDILPASHDLHVVEMELSSEPGREMILRELIDTPDNSKYDFVIMDCPPSLGLLSINALVASNYIIIPVEAEPLALNGMSKILDIFSKVKKRLNPSIEILGILVTKYDKRKIINRDVVKTIETHFKELIFKSFIRDNVTLAEAPSQGVDIIRYAPKSNGAKDYISLAEEVLERTK